jgi:NAD(P)-dependent dehydrogenase (short-subunit alcohol dehydrogenase family)
MTKRTALVTGAGQGVGLGIARALGKAGCAVAVNDLFAERADEAAAVLRHSGTSALAVPFDVTDYDAVADGVRRVAETLGGIDILVNNAGIPTDGFPQVTFQDSDPALWRRFVDLNFYGVLNCTHAVLPALCANGWGRVITISSDAARVGLDINVALYGAAKAGAVGLMRHLSREVAPNGVTVNTLSLGLMGNVESEWAAKVAKTIPRRRLGTPDDIGAAVAFLASDAADWITGQVLPINGGSY